MGQHIKVFARFYVAEILFSPLSSSPLSKPVTIFIIWQMTLVTGNGQIKYRNSHFPIPFSMNYF